MGLYDQIRNHRGIQWPAPTYEIAKAGGTKRRYMGQEGWEDKPYGEFRTDDGKLHIHLCEQNYEGREAITPSCEGGHGTEEGYYLIDHMDVLEKPRDTAASRPSSRTSLPRQGRAEIPKDKYPYWVGLGVVYEHFHTSKTIRCRARRAAWFPRCTSRCTPRTPPISVSRTASGCAS